MNGIEVAVVEAASVGGAATLDWLRQAGPPADLPGPVPAVVERLLGAIGAFVDGVVGGTPAGGG
jgi:hypothetical protein